MDKIVSNIDNLQILHEDNHLIIINKRSGDLVQGDKTGDTPLSDIVKGYIKKKYDKPGAVYLGSHASIGPSHYWNCCICKNL